MTTQPTIPDWLTIGAKVRIVTRGSWNGDRIGSVSHAVARLTATQIILDNGRRFRTKDLQEVGKDWYRADYLISADNPRIADAVAEAARKTAAYGIQDLGPRWVKDRSEENARALRDAIVALAPHLGLTVTAAPNTEENQP